MLPGDSVARDEPCTLETDAVCVFMYTQKTRAIDVCGCDTHSLSSALPSCMICSTIFSIMFFTIFLLCTYKC